MTNGQPPRVLMFAPFFAPLVNPEAIVTSKLALAMRSAGWDVDVISRQYLDDADVELEYGRAWSEPWSSLRPHVHPVIYDRKPGWNSRLKTLGGALRTGHLVSGVKMVPDEVRLALDLHSRHAYDLILSRFRPISGHLTAMIVARRTGLPWIANWNDPLDVRYPDANGTASARGLLERAEVRLAKAVCRSASAVTYPTERLRDFFARSYGSFAQQRSHVIPHIAMATDIASAPPANERFVLCHAGSLLPPRRADVLLRALARLSRREGRSDLFRLRLVGLADASVNGLAAQLGIASAVEYAGKMSYLACLQQLATCDVQLIVEAPCPNGIFLPSKFVDCVQIGRPILAVSPKNGTLSDLLKTHGGGIAADCEDEDAVLRALVTMYDCWKHQRLQQEYGAQRLYDLFDPTRIVAQYATICERICRKATRTDASRCRTP